MGAMRLAISAAVTDLVFRPVFFKTILLREFTLLGQICYEIWG